MKMVTENPNDQDFDPQAEFYDEKGFRYRNFAAWLAQDEDVCPLNRRIRHIQAVYENTAYGCSAFTAWISVCWQEDELKKPAEGDIGARWDIAVACAQDAFADAAGKHPRDCGRTTRTGVARAVTPTLDAVHPADEPEVPRRVGPR